MGEQGQKDLSDIAKTGRGAFLLAQLSFSSVDISIFAIPGLGESGTRTEPNESETGVILKYDPTLTKVDGVETNSFIVLTHELMHAGDIAQAENGFKKYLFAWSENDYFSTKPLGTFSRNRTFFEARAVAMENLVRAELKMELRRNYTGTNIFHISTQFMVDFEKLFQQMKKNQ